MSNANQAYTTISHRPTRYRQISHTDGVQEPSNFRENYGDETGKPLTVTERIEHFSQAIKHSAAAIYRDIGSAAKPRQLPDPASLLAKKLLGFGENWQKMVNEHGAASDWSYTA
jgi:hypothetical protein